MPITTKHTTVYVASDGSEHPTLEAAQAAERQIQLEDMFGLHAAYGEISTREAAERVVECWTAIKAIMEDGYDTPQARLDARRERVAAQDQTSTQFCTCAARRASRYDEATGCWHCVECGGIDTGDSPASVAERAKNEWGGANVAPRPQREQSSSRERSISRRTGTDACRCRTLTPGQLCGACRANVKTDV